MTHVAGLLQQDYFRVRNDDGSETTATWVAAENTNASLTLDTTFRLRFVLDETAGGSATAGFNFYFSRNGGAYTQITTASAARFVTSGNVTDGAATTKQLIGGTGTFSAGVIESAGDGTGNLGINANGHTELEIVVQLNSGTFVVGDTCAFRVYLDNGTTLNTYLATPVITAIAATQNLTDSITLTKNTNTSAQRLLEGLALVNLINNTDATAQKTWEGLALVDLIKNTTASTQRLLERLAFINLTKNTQASVNKLLESLASTNLSSENTLIISNINNVLNTLLRLENEYNLSETRASYITNALLQILSESNLELFEGLLYSVSLILSLDTSDSLLTGSLIKNSFFNLDINIDEDTIINLISNVIFELSQTNSIEIVSNFITDVFVILEATNNIDNYTSLISNILISLHSNYTNIISPLGEAVEFLVLNTSISIENLTTLLSDVIFELSQNISEEAAATFITSVVTSLTFSNNIEEARRLAGAGVLSFVTLCSVESTIQLIAQVHTFLESNTTYTNNRELSRLAQLTLDYNNLIELSSIGIYLATTILEESLSSDIESIATLNGNLSLAGSIRLISDLLLENEARINLNYAITSNLISVSQLFAALEVIFNKDVSAQVARLVFTELSVESRISETEATALNALANIALDYDQSLLNDLTRDLRASLEISTENNTVVTSSLVTTGVLNLNYEIQDTLNRLGILNSEVQIRNAVSLQILKTAILNAGISIENLIVVETTFGFDLFIETPGNRILIVRFDNREMTVTFEDRTKSLTLEDRTKIIPGRS